MKESRFEVGDNVIVRIGVHRNQEGTIKSANYLPMHDVWQYDVDIVDPFDGTEEVRTFAEEHLEPIDEPEEEKKSERHPYREAVEKLLDRQEEKGISKYGVTLDQNTTLTDAQRIEHLEEELVDALMYCEHLKVGISGDGLTANEYQRAALRTAQIDMMSRNDLLQNGVMGLCGEAGECVDIVKKVMFQGHDLDKEALALEISDCLWYAAVAAYAIGYKLSDVMEANIKKLKERYPNGFSKERSINRKENKSEGNGFSKVSSDVQS